MAKADVIRVVRRIVMSERFNHQRSCPFDTGVSFRLILFRNRFDAANTQHCMIKVRMVKVRMHSDAKW